jgi:hypothetical protein
MSDETVSFKDIEFTLDKTGKILTFVERNGWSLGPTNDVEVIQTSWKPRSLALPNNNFDHSAIRKIQYQLSHETHDDPENPAGNLTIREYPNYLFIFDMKIAEELRGMGGGTLMLDLFKGTTIFTDKNIVGGFIGDGNTIDFLRANGFQRAEFEAWTNDYWSSEIMDSSFYTDGHYYDLDPTERFGLAPTPMDIINEFGREYVQPPASLQGDLQPPPSLEGDDVIWWTREYEQKIINEGAPTGLKAEEGEIVFNCRVQKEVAAPYWDQGYSTWFKIPAREIEYEEHIFPITNRSAPVLDRFRDPSYSVFEWPSFDEE